MPVPSHGSSCLTIHYYPTSCPECKEVVFYFECSCGSKVFLDDYRTAHCHFFKSNTSKFGPSNREVIKASVALHQALLHEQIAILRGEKPLPIKWKKANGMIVHRLVTRHNHPSRYKLKPGELKPLWEAYDKSLIGFNVCPNCFNAIRLKKQTAGKDRGKSIALVPEHFRIFSLDGKPFRNYGSSVKIEFRLVPKTIVTDTKCSGH